jgi:hypothetical protein
MKTRNKFLTVVLAALLSAGLTLTSANAYVGVSVAIAPPGIPVYTQPYCPSPGYIWTPGYWAWDGYGYYWVPGDWIYPPTVGFLWTPGYWGYHNGLYAFNDGYWGPHVGFYGGINYGYGYGGHGYYGGRWAGNTFQYNTTVTRVNSAVIGNAYTYKAPVKVAGSRAGFNGPGGAKATATAQEQAAAKANHVQATSDQRALAERAKNNPDLKAKNNNGKPKPAAVAAARGNNGQAAGVAGGQKNGNANAAADRNKTNTAKQTHAKNPSNRATKTTEQSNIKPHHATAAAAASNHKTTQPIHKTEARHPTTSHTARYPLTPMHQPVRRAPTTMHQASHPNSHQAPAGHSQEPNAKKKKKEKPNG